MDAQTTPEVAEVSPVLQLDGVSVAVGREQNPIEILRKVDLTVMPGTTVGLVGESGSGKSMTCLTAAGLLAHVGGRVVDGRVLVAGRDMTRASERDWSSLRGSHVGFVFQQPLRSLNPTFTVGEQIAEVLRVKKKLSRRSAWQGAVSLLDRVHIADAERRARDYPHMMSGGMAQRAAIAIAIACSPQLLIADEPTTALDVTVGDRVLKLLRELQQEMGLAIVYVSHDLAVIGDISERVVVMYAGEVVDDGPAADIFERPAHPYARGLLAATPRMGGQGKLAFVAGSVPQPSEYPDSCRFSARCSWADDECDVAPIQLVRYNGQNARCVRLETVNG